MRRALRMTALVGAVLLLGLGVYLVPTIWGKPWSIENFYTRVFLETLLRHPMLLTQLRVLETYGIRAHNQKLDDYSVAFAEQEAEFASENLRTLRSYAPDSQTPDQQFSSQVLDWFLQINVDGQPYLLYDYPLNQLDGVQVTLPDFMINVHPLYDARDAEDYVARLARFGTAIDQVIASVKTRAENKLVPPRFVVERVRGQVDTFRAGGAEQNVLFTSFVDRIGKIERLSPESRQQLAQAALQQVENTVLPAWQRLADYLPELQAQATAEVGAWKHPAGSLYYGWALRYHTSTKLSADEIHALGLREVDRIQGEMRAILAAEGIAVLDDSSVAPDPAPTAQDVATEAADEAEVVANEIATPAGENATTAPTAPEAPGPTAPAVLDLASTLRALNAEERFLYPDDDAGRAQVLADYQSILDETAPKLETLFGRLPKAPVRVERIPAFKEAGAPGAYYMPPPLDGSKPGIFYANLRDVRDIAKFSMRTLAYHEAIPGHHMQIAIAQELPGLPIFRRVIPFTAYVEGWALYAERLALENQFHPTAFDRLGALIAEVFRATRLVVDTGIHAQRWTREQAIDYMARNTGMPETDVVAEVERYIVSPGQACAYKTGQLAILSLRERAREALGARFDQRAFHDVVLGHGALPLELLELKVSEWIADQATAKP